MNILNTLTGVTIGGVKFPHHSISGITHKKLNNRSKLVVNVLPGYYGVPEKLSFYFDQIELPVAVSAEDLITTILAYNNGYNISQTLIATEGQDTFLFRKPIESGNIKVTIDDMETLAYTISDDGEIVLKSACEGGERVSVLNFE